MPIRDELLDGTRIERNYRTDERGKRTPYGSWFWVVYDPDRMPHRKRVNLRTKDRRVAMRKAADCARDYGMGTFDPWSQSAAQRGTQLQEAIDRFLKMQARSGKSLETVSSDASLLGRLERSLPAGTRVDHVEKRHVEAFINARKPIPKSKKKTQARGEERSPSTKARMLATLRHFFGWAADEGLTRSDPTEGIKLKGARGNRRDHITVEEEAALLEAIAGHEKAAGVSRIWLRHWIVFGTHTGLRPSEQQQLKWSAVRLGENMIEIGKGHDVKTEASRRVVPVRGPALEVLRHLHKVRTDEDDGYVFVGAGGDKINLGYLRKRLKKFSEEARINSKTIVPYSLRHSFGTRAALGGVPLFHIARMMGTSVAMVEKHYAHYVPSRGAEYLDALYTHNTD